MHFKFDGYFRILHRLLDTFKMVLVPWHLMGKTYWTEQKGTFDHIQVNYACVVACWTTGTPLPSFTCPYRLSIPVNCRSLHLYQKKSVAMLLWTRSGDRWMRENCKPPAVFKRLNILTVVMKMEPEPNGHYKGEKEEPFTMIGLTCLEMWACNKIWQVFPPENSQSYVTGV